MTYMAIVWIIICIIMVIAEIATLQFISIWFAGGAFSAFISSFFLPFEWQFGIFVASSSLLLICTMPLIKKFKNQKHTPTNYDIDIGKDVIIIQTVNKKRDSGRATLNGVDWIAVAENENDIIEEGEIVKIKDIQGAKLIVSRK